MAEAKSPEALLAARRFHGQRYLESGFVHALDADGVIEDEYVAECDYFVVKHEPDSRIVGVCRFIRNSTSGLPILDNFEVQEPWRSSFTYPAGVNCYEISALATESTGLQHFAVAGCLYRQVFRYLDDHPRHVHILAVVDQRLFRLLRRGLHFPFEQIGPAADYMGDQTIPTYGYLPDLMQSVLDADPTESSFLFDGRAYEEMNTTVIDLREQAPEIAEIQAGSVA